MQGTQLVQCRPDTCTFDDRSQVGFYSGEYFGYSVDVDDAGRRLAVGAPGGNQAFVTTVTGLGPGGPEGIGLNNATELATGSAPGQFFGASVGLAPDGNTVVVGSPDLPDNDDGDPGEAFVIKANGGDWNFVQPLTGANGGSLWTFGDAVDINEGFVVVGQPPSTREGDRATSSPTGFLVWDHPDGFFVQSEFFNQAGDEGKAVALGDDTLHVGIPGGFGADNPTRGGVGFYELDSNTGQFVSRGNRQDANRLGESVAADKGTVISGQSLSEQGGVREGAVWFFSTDLSGPVEAIRDPFPLGTGSTAPDPDVRLGFAVALDGNRMAVSAPDADLGAVDSGAVYIYERADAVSPWVLSSTVAPPSPEFQGRFGDALDLRGDLLAVGESDRLGDSAEPGRVWVFALDAGVWSVVGGGFVTALPESNGDHFGASLAWIDDSRVAVGAPGENSATGQVSIARLVPGESATWSVTDLSTTNGSQDPLDAGDQLGYAVAFDDSPAGDGRLVAGAPGASRRYSWNIPSSGVTIGNPGLAQFNETFNMGSAVDISGDRVVTAGYSDELRVNVNEATPIQRTSTTPLGAVLPSGAAGSVINDYVDIEGANIAVSRGGGGGQVELYTVGEGPLTLANPVIYSPAVDPGDLLGFAVDLDGRTLVAGAPGANADAGAVFSEDVGVTATWTGPFSGGTFADPSNWDLGVVPGAGDTAVIPESVLGVIVDGTIEVGRLELDGSAIALQGPGQLTSSSTSLVNGALIGVAPESELVLRNDVRLDGFITVSGDGLEGQLVLDGDVTMTGDGQLDLSGDLTKTGTGTATIDIGDGVVPGDTSGLITGPGTNVAVLGGALSLTGADLEVAVAPGPPPPGISPGLAGEAFVAAGAVLQVNGNLLLTDQTSIGVDIDGDASTTDNYGRIEVDGELSLAGELFVNDIDIVPGETYPILTSTGPTSGSFDTVPAGLETTVSPTEVSVSIGACDTEWTGAAGNGFWATPGNWSSGVPTSGDVACLDGTGDVTIGEDTQAEVGRFDIANQRIVLDGQLTVGDTSFLDQGIDVSGVLGRCGRRDPRWDQHGVGTTRRARQRRERCHARHRHRCRPAADHCASTNEQFHQRRHRQCDRDRPARLVTA